MAFYRFLTSADAAVASRNVCNKNKEQKLRRKKDFCYILRVKNERKFSSFLHSRKWCKEEKFQCCNNYTHKKNSITANDPERLL